MTTIVRHQARRAFGLSALALLCAGVVPAADAATTWAVDPTQSTIYFVGKQQGEAFTGLIKSYQATIRYAPEDLPGSVLDVTMDLKSIDTKSPDRDQALATDAWFDYKRFPTATFKSVGALRAAPQGATADADLTIKGKTKRIAFPFRFASSASGATLDAKVMLNRLDFGLGAGEWADNAVIGQQVEVVVHLALKPAAAK